MKAWLLIFLMVPAIPAQISLDPVLDPVDDLAGQVIPPIINEAYAFAGQNFTREDIAFFVDLNITQGGVGLLGLLLGSGKAQLEATIQIRGEMRVISSDRLRAIVQGENSYNITAENATFLSEVYLPAELFRASASAEMIAAFKAEQEIALERMVEALVPELQILRLDIAWENVSPFESVRDSSLVEPPIVVTLDAVVRYLRVESIPSLLSKYIEGPSPEKEAKKDYIRTLKEENSDPLRTRDFFAAAAFSQLVNISMQPGWRLDIDVSLPRGYSLEYASDAIYVHDARHASISVNALETDSDVREVFVYSLTHRKAVALVLFATMLALVGIVNLPGRWLYGRFRLPKKTAKWELVAKATVSSGE